MRNSPLNLKKFVKPVSRVFEMPVIGKVRVRPKAVEMKDMDFQ